MVEDNSESDDEDDQKRDDVQVLSYTSECYGGMNDSLFFRDEY